MFNKKIHVRLLSLFFPDSKKFKYILHQHTKNFSYIIIVNNSQNKSQLLKKEQKNLSINNKTNIGLAKALNIGIKKAKKVE